MKKLHRVAAFTAVVSLFATSATFAQVSEDGMGKVIPVELFACDFLDGKGPEDLNAVIAQWTEFMDDRKTDSYAAWLLTPYYYGMEQDFDVIWMGASTDGNAMGQGTHDWLTEGGEVAGGFAEVINCRAHIGLASAMYKSPPQNETPESSIITMMDCNMNEGTRYSDVRSAELEWAKYMTENGSEAGTWHWFPVFGGGDQDYDYKIVNAYRDFKLLGADWEQSANGGGREAANELFGDLDECDDARVYVARSVRAAQLRK